MFVIMVRVFTLPQQHHIFHVPVLKLGPVSQRRLGAGQQEACLLSGRREVTPHWMVNSRQEVLHSLRSLDGVLNISAYKVETLRASLMWAGWQAAWPGCFKGMRN